MKKTPFALFSQRVRLAAALVVLIFAPFALPKDKPKEPATSYRTYPYQYAKVWNAVVRLLIEDLNYAPQVADPQLGFFSTAWKASKIKSRDKRSRLHINVKSAPDGTLVTIRCEAEIFIPIQGTNQGKWVEIATDNSCESQFLDRLDAKLKRST